MFNQNHTNADIYNETLIDSFVDKSIQGYNSTIFAYGQTGSGKTYTLEGNKHHPGT